MQRVRLAKKARHAEMTYTVGAAEQKAKADFTGERERERERGRDQVPQLR